jgi:hypothetical protein
MKRLAGLAFMFCVILLGCNKEEETSVREVKVDYHKESIRVMDEMRPKLYGSWTMESLTYDPTKTATGGTGSKKDTTLLNFGTLNINLVDNSSRPDRPENNDVTGGLTFRKKLYPIGFKMLASAEGINNRPGPQTFAFFEFRFPEGSHITEADESYLQNLTLIGNNYSISMSKDGKTMVWQALNGAMKNISFVKK